MDKTFKALYGRTDVDVEVVKKFLSQIGFTQNVLGDPYLHHEKYNSLFVAVLPLERECLFSSKKNALTISTDIRSECIPVEILNKIKKGIQDLLLLDVEGNEVVFK